MVSILHHNARLSRACYRLPLQPIVPERESAREGIIALGSAGRSRSVAIGCIDLVVCSFNIYYWMADR
ncbi:hypothetical protein ER57_16425 [Smithella sp. SCADC]|nr:hypothetical protein ER57_16425 [Smithella sp. SCADC]